jgi:ATP-dependent helicase Lhr and Lhr-like helicase
MRRPDQRDPLPLFHPLIRKWFAEKVGTPTDIQSRAWPEIARGRHVLVTAPTGSGKTLMAFLWAIHQLVTGTWAPGYAPRSAANLLDWIKEQLLIPVPEWQELKQAMDRDHGSSTAERRGPGNFRPAR